MTAIYEYTTTRRLVSEAEAAQCDNPAGAYATVRDLCESERERLIVVLLDRKHRAIGRELLYAGTLTGCSVRIAELFTLAVRMGAAAILIAHNHPSGDTTPSPDDMRTTGEAISAGKLLGIPLVDHLIVGSSGQYYSMREHSSLTFEASA